MSLDKETETKIRELQILEQNLHNVSMQKQNFHFELSETMNAIAEVTNTDDEVYKSVGSVIIKSDKATILKELEEKKKIGEMRFSSMEKQEKLISTKLEELKEELKEVMQRGEK